MTTPTTSPLPSFESVASLADDEFTLVKDRDDADDADLEDEATLSLYALTHRTRSPEVGVEVRETSRWEAPDARAVYEVVTRNCAYHLNARLDCVAVVDVVTGRALPAHPLLGAWLAGGRTAGAHGDSYSYPLPSPGSKAVFQLPGGHVTHMAETSCVERVTLTQHHFRPPQPQPNPRLLDWLS